MGNWVTIHAAGPAPARKASLGSLAAAVRRSVVEVAQAEGLRQVAFLDWVAKQVFVTGSSAACCAASAGIVMLRCDDVGDVAGHIDANCVCC